MHFERPDFPVWVIGGGGSVAADGIGHGEE